MEQIKDIRFFKSDDGKEYYFYNVNTQPQLFTFHPHDDFITRIENDVFEIQTITKAEKQRILSSREKFYTKLECLQNASDTYYLAEGRTWRGIKYKVGYHWEKHDVYSFFVLTEGKTYYFLCTVANLLMFFSFDELKGWDQPMIDLRHAVGDANQGNFPLCTLAEKHDWFLFTSILFLSESVSQYHSPKIQAFGEEIREDEIQVKTVRKIESPYGYPFSNRYACKITLNRLSNKRTVYAAWYEDNPDTLILTIKLYGESNWLTHSILTIGETTIEKMKAKISSTKKVRV